MKNTHLDQDDVYLQAAQWLDRLADGPLDNISKKRFCNWLDANEQHVNVFNAMTHTWQDPSLEQAIKEAKRQLTWREKISTQVKPRIMLTSLSLCALVLLVVVIYPTNNSTPLPNTETLYSQHFATKIAEQRDYALVDGSTLQMSADSAVSVDFGANRRVVELQKGATYFSVASDKTRPFEVNLGKASVVAVGTQFNIDRGASGSDVTVYEGAIEVRAWPNSAPTLLRTGESVHIGAQGLSAIEPVELSQLVDWRSGWIEIKDKPLSYLVERLNRQSEKNITLGNAEIANLRVAGRFRLRDTSQTLAMLGEVYNLSISDNTNKIVVTYPTP